MIPTRSARGQLAARADAADDPAGDQACDQHEAHRAPVRRFERRSSCARCAPRPRPSSRRGSGRARERTDVTAPGDRAPADVDVEDVHEDRDARRVRSDDLPVGGTDERRSDRPACCRSGSRKKFSGEHEQHERRTPASQVREHDEDERERAESRARTATRAIQRHPWRPALRPEAEIASISSFTLSFSFLSVDSSNCSGFRQETPRGEHGQSFVQLTVL